MKIKGCSFMLCCIFVLIVSSLMTAGINAMEWHWRNPLPQGNTLRGAAYGDNTFVAVGDAGTILQSGPLSAPRPVPRGGGGSPPPDPGPGYPLPPEGFNAVPGAGFPLSVNLGWLPGASPNIAKYMLYASTGSGASSAGVGVNEAEDLRFYLLAEVPSDILEYTHSGLSENVKYYYVVIPVNEEGLESNVSSTILWHVAGTNQFGELDAVSWGPERIIAEPEAEDSSGCFIATAAYGSPMVLEVSSLRAFRDRFLLTNRFGRGFTNAYYSLSPAAAEVAGRNGMLRFIARLHLAPVVRAAGLVAGMN